jgi:putative PIN family toxin of toxin-antitoxin system
MSSSRRRRLRVVLDSNVWVSAAIWGGRPAEVVELAEQGKIEIFISAEILSEISRILDYGRLRSIYEGAGVRKWELMASIAGLAGFVVVANRRLEVVGEDPSDDRVLECAVEVDADYIVSGDKHLLRLGEYLNIKIIGSVAFSGLEKDLSNIRK